MENEEKKVNNEKTLEQDVKENKGMAIVAYIIFFIPLLTSAKDSRFARFHVNQGLVLLLTSVTGSICLPLIPFAGWFLTPIFGLLCFVLFILGILAAANGEMKELPIIGKITLIK